METLEKEVKREDYENLVLDYLNYLECYPDENEVEKIINLSKLQDAYSHNKGIRFGRTEFNPRELAFYEQWLKENRPDPRINHGNGILQDLFMDSGLSVFNPSKVYETITNRDRIIVATVIQWLGSNCGIAFLGDALNRCGYRITQNKSELPIDSTIKTENNQ